MTATSTKGIYVSVTTRYWPEESDPQGSHFFFVYFITIRNTSKDTVQLLRRRWEIFDSSGEKRYVEGEGVVGQTPVLEPGATYTYNSGCNLSTEIGRMSGHYIMKNLEDDSEFEVAIPEFLLEYPYRLN